MSRLNVAVTVQDLINALPDILTLRARCRSLAMLDAVMSPEWEYRWYSFDSGWAPGEEMASMRNGSGDAYSIVFGSAGAFVRGFDHESVMSPYRLTPPRLWPGLVDNVPAVFGEYVAEPAFSLPGLGLLAATVCLWRQINDDEWHAGALEFPVGNDDPDGAGWMFDLLVDGSPSSYQRFAEEYYEVSIDVTAVEHIYAMRPLTQDLVRALNPEVSWESLSKDVAEIGYPASSGSSAPD